MSLARITEILERGEDIENCKGKVFNYNYRNTLALSGQIDFAILTPSQKTRFLPVQIQCDKECQIDFYMDATITAGTGTNILTSIGCLNQYNPRTTKISDARINPTITDLGTHVYPDWIYASQFTAGQTIEGLQWFLKPESWYVCRIINQDSQAGTLKVNMFWIEC